MYIPSRGWHDLYSNLAGPLRVIPDTSALRASSHEPIDGENSSLSAIRVPELFLLLVSCWIGVSDRMSLASCNPYLNVPLMDVENIVASIIAINRAETPCWIPETAIPGPLDTQQNSVGNRVQRIASYALASYISDVEQKMTLPV